MPSGKQARQRRRAAAAAGGGKPPPVRSKGGGRRHFSVSRRAILVGTVVLLVLIGLGAALPLALSSSGSAGGQGSSRLAPLSTLGRLMSAPPPGGPGPEGPPIEGGPNLAPAGSPSPGHSVDGIPCQGGEQVAFHIHSRLTIFVDGRPRTVPYGVGIADPQNQPGIGVPFVVAGACVAWLHTHAADGVIHVEAPVQRPFTLGNFFDVWGQPLSRTQVGPARGPVTALLDGKVWRGNPRQIPLRAHAQIQLEVGRPLVAPIRITNWSGL